MPTLSQIRALDPAALTTAADATETANIAFGKATDQVDRHVDHAFSTWHGDAAVAAAARAWSDRVVGRGIANAVTEHVDALRVASAALIPARDTVVRTADNATAAGFTVHDDGTVVPPRCDTGDARADVVGQACLDDEALTFEVQLKSALSSFDQLDRDAADTIDQITIRLSTFGGDFRTQGLWALEGPDGHEDADIVMSGRARDSDLERIGRALSSDSGVSIEYLDAFYNGLGQDELTELFATFKEWEDDGDPSAAGWADAVGNGLLTLSNPDYGGGWDRVPQDIRDTLHYGYEPGPREPGSAIRLERLDALGAMLGEANPEYRPGTQMGVELNRVAGYMAGVPTYADPHVVPTPDPSYYDKTARTFLDIGTRNPDASYHLLSGTGVDGSPAQFDRDEVLVPLFTREWEDDGSTLAGLTDWIAADAIPPDPTDPVDVARAERAGQAAFGLAETLSSPKSGWDGSNNFDRFLHMPETDGHPSDRTIGSVNPTAVQSFSEALAPYASDMVGADADATPTHGFGDLGPVPATRVFTLLDTDPAAGALVNGAALAQATDFDRRFALDQVGGEGKYSYGTYSGRLQSLVEVGLSSAYENEKAIEQAAIDTRNQYRSDAYAVAQTLVTGALTALPGGVVAGPMAYSTGVLLDSEIINAEGRYVGHASGIEGLDTSMYLTETSARSTTNYNMFSALIESGTVDRNTLPADWIDSGGLKQQNAFAGNVLTDQVPDLLANAGVPKDVQAYYLGVSAAGQQDLLDIVYADRRDGSSGFREVLLGDVVPSGGERWDYSQ
ncbi:TPR repeat region-containing protein [Rhodococcus sp. SJ-3]|uniref:TPR repeat region-containing protein n=1 Tax=Rhodococcus sp. SJ-3 TaxID=3454628 RepID=UPI003F7A309B